MKMNKWILLMLVFMLSAVAMFFDKPVYADGYDTTAPTIEKISFEKEIVKPGVLKMEITLTEEETGASQLWLTFFVKMVRKLLYPVEVMVGK